MLFTYNEMQTEEEPDIHTVKMYCSGTLRRSPAALQAYGRCYVANIASGLEGMAGITY